MSMSQREVHEQVRKLCASDAPDTQLLARAIGVFDEQVARMSAEINKLKNDVQQLKSARASVYRR